MKKLKIGYYMLNPKYFKNKIDLFYFDGTVPYGWETAYSGWPFEALISSDKRDLGSPHGYLASDMIYLKDKYEVIEKLFS